MVEEYLSAVVGLARSGVNRSYGRPIASLPPRCVWDDCYAVALAEFLCLLGECLAGAVGSALSGVTRLSVKRVL